MYARTNYLIMVCDKFRAKQEYHSQWTVEVLHGPAPILDTIPVINPSEINRRFANGDQCFLVQDGQRCLGFTWGHTGECYIRGAGERLTLSPQSVYLYNVYTIEEMRRKGICDAIQEAFFRYYRERDVTRAYTMIEKGNLIMKKVFLKAGFEIKSKIHYVRYGMAGIRCVYNYETKKLTVQLVKSPPRDCAII